MSFDEYMAIVRILVLRLLDDDPAGSLPVIHLHDALLAEKLTLTRDQVIGQLEWLQGQGLLTIDAGSALTTATISRLGSETARGLATVSGILHPRKL